MLDSMKSELPCLTKDQQMEYHLLYAKAMNKADVLFTTDSIAKLFVDYYDANGTQNEKMLAHYLLGCVYRDMGEGPLALQCYYDAVSFADDSKYSYKMLRRIHGQMAYIYECQAMVKDEIDELRLAAKYSYLLGDTIDAMLRTNRIAEAYTSIGKHDSAYFYKEQVMETLKRMGEEEWIAKVGCTVYGYLLENGGAVEVKKRFGLYESKTGYFHNGEIESGREGYYYVKGRYLLAVNKLDSAELMFRKCLHFMNDPNMKVCGYRGLSLLYNKLNKPDSTAKYALLAYDANDSAYQINVAERAMSIKSMFNYNKHQQEAMKNLRERNTAYNWLLLTLAAIVALVLTGYAIIKRMRKRNALRHKMIIDRYETEKRLLQKEMEELNVLLEEKDYIIGNNNKAFEVRKRELFLEIEGKEKEIVELQERVQKYERDLGVKDEAAMEELLLHSEIRSLFEHSVKRVKERPSEEMWDELTAFARTNLPKLFLLLKNNSVSERERRMVILVRLGFKPGEIATIMGCSFPDVSLTRSRLLKKIYGIDGRAIDFDKRIMLMN